MAVEQGHVFPGNVLSHGGKEYAVVGDIQSSIGTLTVVSEVSRRTPESLELAGVERIVSRDALVSEAALVEEATEDQAQAANDQTVVPGVVPQGQPQPVADVPQTPPQAPPSQVPQQTQGGLSASNQPPTGGNQ